MAEFRMPSLGADMDEGTLLEWLVKPGDAVHKGDIVAVVDTAKSAVEVECFDTGVIEEILVRPGEVVPVGTLLATISTGAGPTGAPAAAAEPTEPAPRPDERPKPLAGPLVRKLADQLGVDLTTVRGTGKGAGITRADVQRAAGSREAEPPTAVRPRVTPYARRLAKELGVDLARVVAAGADGVVRVADVRSAAEPPAPAQREQAAPTAAAGRVEAMRATTARLMARSKREIPHYYLSTTIDMTTAMAWLREVNRELPVEERVLPVALMLKACAVAARRVPQLNGFWIDDHFEPATAVHIGVAVSLRGGGLVTPAITDTADLAPADLMDRLRDLVARARAGRLRASELTSATITVTNLGDRGVESVLGVIYPPQVALVGLGKVLDRPWAVGGMLGARPVVTATLSADHRATDGHVGARFLENVDHSLNHPEEL
ncbi:dihydrolipoamide acetyltransferase family protein [Allokutzneria oryzae]|uniref:Dihydrolipoamide acetyltransferase component of pyruvate dehydrogenase complex n=1 Tax=Allokutzneria oryzae TaxID=1378989 RepID=A0ABV5ZX07_9PSEU